MSRTRSNLQSISLECLSKPTALYLISLLILVLSIVLMAVMGYQQATKTAQNRSKARADLAAELVASTFMSRQYSLKILADTIHFLANKTNPTQGIDKTSLQELLEENSHLTEVFDDFFVADASGKVLYTTGHQRFSQIPGWKFMRRQLDPISGEDFLLPPYWDPEEETTWLWNIHVHRARYGEISTVFATRQSSASLGTAMARLSLSAGQTLSILDTSGSVVISLPSLASQANGTGANLKIKSPYLEDFINSGNQLSQIVAKSPLDGLERLYTIKRITGTPYLTVVGEDTSAILRDWRVNVLASGAGVLLVSLIGLVLLKQFRSRVAAENALRAENLERKRLQERAQANQSRLAALVQSIPGLIFTFNKQGHIEFVHADDESLLLEPKFQLIGKHYGEILPPEATKLFDNVREKIDRTRLPQIIEYQLTLNRVKNYFRAKVSPLIDGQNKNSGCIALVQDITDDKSREAELRIASTAFHTHLGMIITDQDYIVQRVNQAATKITGYKESELIGFPFSILRSDPNNQMFYKKLRKIIAESGSWEGEIWRRRKNGSFYEERLTVSAVRNSLTGTISNYVCTFHDISKRKEAERQVHQLAHYDKLTGLSNLDSLGDKISQISIEFKPGQNEMAALFYIDIQKFRSINDIYGHNIGDNVLKIVADRLATTIEKRWSLARLGSDEFAILAPGLGYSREKAEESAQQIANNLINQFSLPLTVATHQIQIVISIGVTFIDEKGENIHHYLQRAEQANQQAKNRIGTLQKGVMAIFNPQEQDNLIERAMLQKDLETAITDDQLLLYFQPQIGNPDILVGYEVLLRWQHPDRGMISPAVFIPLAEESGYIVPISYWIIEQACKKLSDWKSDPTRSHLTLAVNLSAVQFKSENFQVRLMQILHKTAAPPHLLKLEVTESLLMQDPELVANTMNSIRLLGVQFSLDDFGTGYSSLSYLKRLPLNQIKIDRSFIQDVNINPASAAITRSIIGLANGLGLEVIAEGVETEKQKSWLLEYGCNNFQGYLFGKPMELPDDNES